MSATDTRASSEVALRRLVAWPTVCGRPLDAQAAFLAEQAEGAGFSVEVFPYAEGRVNLVCRKGPRSEDPARGLVLSGHMDVVPVDGQGWSSDPFSLTERDGRLFGRGSADMKGFVAATVATCEALKDEELDEELVLVWTCEEERGCLGALDLVRRLEAEGGPPALPRATVIGEPTSFRVLRLHPGHATWRVVCQGRPAHSSRPTLGLSAIKIARRVLGALEALEAQLAADRAFEAELPSPWTILNPAIIQGGEAVNIVPERCEITVAARPLPGVDAAVIEAALLEALTPVVHTARARGGDVVVEPLHACPGLLTSPTCAHMGLLTPWAPEPTPGGAPFATDGGALALLGCEPLVFGPGSIDVAHRPDEYLDRADLFRAVDAISDIIRRACVRSR